MKPSWILRFDAAAFGARVACLGQQVEAIVSAIDLVLPSLNWFAGDVECSGRQIVSGREPTPAFVGETQTLRTKLSGVDQFGSGVLVGTRPECRDPRFREGGLWTEDEEFADLEDAVVEIRMFDTSYISVASTDERIRTQLLGARWSST